jgi:hypothetical protein
LFPKPNVGLTGLEVEYSTPDPGLQTMFLRILLFGFWFLFFGGSPCVRIPLAGLVSRSFVFSTEWLAIFFLDNQVPQRREMMLESKSKWS